MRARTTGIKSLRTTATSSNSRTINLGHCESNLSQLSEADHLTYCCSRIIPKTARITGLVSLSLDPDTADSDFIQVKYHKDQANDKDYSHEGLGFIFKKWQADQVAKHMDSPEVAEFEADKHAAKEPVRKYGTGTEEGQAPKEDFTN
jgi:hypothetical protein